MPGANWEALFGAGWGAQCAAADPQLQPWLQGDGSLTEKLRGVSRDGFNVVVLHQTLAYANAAAATALGIDQGAAMLHREVLLCDGTLPLVFACSLLPELALEGDYAALRQLDDRPLGQWIFAEPALRRAQMQFACLSREAPLFVRLQNRGVADCDQLWGRVTCFSGAAAPLLVSEFFLPGLYHRLDQRSSD